MNSVCRLLVMLLLSLLATASWVLAQSAEKKSTKKPSKSTAVQARKSFALEVLPLLKSKCFACHGEDTKKIEGKFNLATRAGLLKGGESGEAGLVPGKPEESPIFRAVKWDGLEMPPKENDRLTKQQIALVRLWIEAGAPWPTDKEIERIRKSTASADQSSQDNEAAVIVSTSGGLSAEWTDRKYNIEDLWAYQPIRRPAVPNGTNDDGKIRNQIDAFISRKLAEKEIQPAPLAEGRTLIRRATFDLTGLPPTPNAVEEFINDKSPDAFDTLVDRLFDSKQYGEQQARHWLDVVRYADTAGFSNDFERPNAWRYRDYVIRSFNNDKPFDRFVVEQLAGDELDANDTELLIATGFLRMGPWEHTGMSVAVVTRQQFLDDVTHSVGVTFLAQGLRCARCHDHKFDPVPTRDYYRIQAVFAPVQFVDREVPYRSSENTRSFSNNKQLTEQRLQKTHDLQAALRQKNEEAITAFLKEKGVSNLNELAADKRPKKRMFGLTKLELSLGKIYQKRNFYYQREMKRYEPFAYSVYNGPLAEVSSLRDPIRRMPAKAKLQGAPQEIHILKGGGLESPMEKVTPGVLSAVAHSNDTVQPTAWNTIPQTMQGRRLALAKWIASPDNTLTARVIVNRIWQQHFRTGLVATSNNFGKMGAKPSHPELLDWLATWFIEHGWSIKKLHRLIMTSKTYRSSSQHPDHVKLDEIDANNRLLAYYPVRRLTAEEIRDSMLTVSGELNREVGGPGVFPEINWDVALQPRQIMGSVAPAYQPSLTPDERNRRTIYAFRYRTLPDPMLEVFNRPGADTSCERRDETTITTQAFALFNSHFAHDRAIALAARLAKEVETPEQQIQRAYRLLFGRNPSKNVLNDCLQHVAEMTLFHRTHKPQVVHLPTKVTRKMVEELTGEEYSWDEELDLMKKYQPDLKPWDVTPEVRTLAELCLVLLNSNEFIYVR